MASKHFLSGLSRARDISLFSCFIGIACADIKKLKLPAIIVGVDWKQWITMPAEDCYHR